MNLKLRKVVLLALLGVMVLTSSCNLDVNQEEDTLPILGEREEVNGETIYHEIPDFTFVNQDSQLVNNATFEDKIYIADFFFTHCPTICPKMTKQMKRVHDQYLDNPDVAFISHSIDVKNDTVARLKWYAESIGVNSSDKWHFVTGDKDEIYEIAEDYFSIALEDDGVAGGFDHSGRLILIDKARRIRSFADGTNPEEVDRLMKDMDKLLEEYQPATSGD